MKLPNPPLAADQRARRVATLTLLSVVLALALATTALAAAPPTSGIASQPAVGSPPVPPALSVRSAILVEQSTGQVLYASNADAEVPIASTTKLMTALLTLEHVAHLSKMFTAPNYYAAPGDSQIALVPGERMSVHDLLLALLVPSADDAAEDLAYNVGNRSVARFVGMMNARARELGLAHTHYSTPSGLDTPGNYSSARDLVKLSIYVVEHYPWLRHAVSLPRAVLLTGSHRRYVTSTNYLLSRVPWINGIKTGHTGAAGYVLVGSGTRAGVTLVSAVLGTASQAARDSNTLALLGYGFSNFRLEQPVVTGAVVARPTVSNSPGVRVGVIAGAGLSEVVARNTRLTERVDVPRQLTGPLKDHAVVGKVVVSDGRRVLARIPVELTRALPAISQLTIIGRFLTRPTSLIVLVLLLGGASVLARRRWGRRPAETAHGSLSAAPAAVAERAAVADEASAPEQAGGAELAAAAEREIRRAEREARRRAGSGDPAPTSSRDRA